MCVFVRIQWSIINQPACPSRGQSVSLAPLGLPLCWAHHHQIQMISLNIIKSLLLRLHFTPVCTPTHTHARVSSQWETVLSDASEFLLFTDIVKQIWSHSTYCYKRPCQILQRLEHVIRVGCHTARLALQMYAEPSLNIHSACFLKTLRLRRQ